MGVKGLITTRSNGHCIPAAQKNPPTVKDGKGCPFRIAATMAMIKAIKWQIRARNIKAITAPFQSEKQKQHPSVLKTFSFFELERQ